MVRQTLAAKLSPRGNWKLELQEIHSEQIPSLAEEVIDQIRTAFQQGRSYGILHLGISEVGTPLAPSVGFLRDFGQNFVAKACNSLAPTNQRLTIPDMTSEEMAEWVLAVPPMQGAEYVSPILLTKMWRELEESLTKLTQDVPGGVQAYLKQHNAIWNVVGRVCLHLAENKRDVDYPFAFLATYAHKVSRQAKVQHKPLGQALREYAGARKRQQLLSLLEPLSRAAEHSELLHELVDSGDIYHPLSWTAEQAYQLLNQLQIYEQAGLVVSVPDWWNAKNRPRPKVRVSLGSQAPSKFGLDSMMDFTMGVCLDGEELSQQELQQLLSASEGLVLLKGKWVEVDQNKLAPVLGQWQAVLEQARTGGISFGEAMRMLAGAWNPSADSEIDEQDVYEWSEIQAGPWLAEQLNALRSPEIQQEIQANAGLKAQLRGYQKHGVQWLAILRTLGLGGCLADDMGLGKTIQVLGLLSLLRRQKGKGTDLLVVPASLLGNWSSEIERFAPDLKVMVAHPSAMKSADLKVVSKKSVQKYHVILTTYGTVLRSSWIQEFPWRHVILDEAQAIKNPTSKQTRAVKRLSSQWRLALTGTPVENRLSDLWSIFDFINPGLLGTHHAFDAMCNSMASHARGYAPLRSLVQTYILRRLKTDKNIIQDLPDKVEVRAQCLLSKRQAALYQKSVLTLERSLEELSGIERRGLILAYLMRFKQICNHPSHWLGDGNFEPNESGKFLKLRELCEPIAERQEKVLVFTQFKEMAIPLSNYLASLFGNTGLVLHGGTPIKRRAMLVRSFQEDDDVPYMVLSLKAGGTGLNLTAASHVIHFDRWWNPAVENQATDRAFRIGQKNNVLVHKFVCRGTIEERIDELIAEKQHLSQDVLGGECEFSLTEMSNEQLLSLVALDIHSAQDS
jgi:superfamily II DNA or RNA helicase